MIRVIAPPLARLRSQSVAVEHELGLKLALSSISSQKFCLSMYGIADLTESLWTALALLGAS